METASIYEAKTQLSKYITMIENKKEESVIITKNGVPVAELIPFRNRKERRIGIAKGLWRDVSEEEFNNFDMLAIMQGVKE